ncbi:MAG: LysR family transcriptional regulator [Mycobacterium sp.]
MRPGVDANLLIALDVLLTEQSVTRAAGRLHTSPASMSRTLSRLRRVLGDPLLVRAGQHMIPTPRAEAMRAEVNAVVRQLGVLLAPAERTDPALLRTTFTAQVGDLVTAALAPRIFSLAEREAPGVSIRFLPEQLEGGPALRDGRVDLEVGVLDHVDPETVTEELLTLAMVFVMRRGHPLSEGDCSPERVAEAAHITVSRRGRFTGPIDAALAELELQRRVVGVLPSHVTAMTLSSRSDMVCLVPLEPAAASPAPLRDLALDMGLSIVEPPFALPSVVIGMAWHPSNSADGAHAWLRSAVRRVLTPGGAVEGRDPR